MPYEPDWESLLREFEYALDTTPKKRDADYKALVNSLDAINDEIKSGENIDSVVDRLIPLMKRIFDYPHWNLKQTVIFAFNHIWSQLGDKSLKYLQGGSNSTGGVNLMPLWLSNLSNSKREIRDATAQNFGVLAKVVGSALLEQVEESIDQIVAGVGKEQWEILEGWSMGLGYIIANCFDITEEEFAKLFEILYEFANHDLFPSYSNYVRLHAIRAMARICKNEVGMLLKYSEQVRDLIAERTHDENMDVRKACAQLDNTWLHLLLNRAQDAQEKHDLLVNHIDSLQQQMSNAASWHARHGCAYALKLLCFQIDVIRFLNQGDIVSLAGSLSAIVHHEHSESQETMSVMCSANSTASSALVKLFVSFCSLYGSGAGQDSVDQLANQTAQMSLNDSDFKMTAKQFYEEYVHQEMVYTLDSPQPTLLDVGGTNLQQLMIKEKEFVREYLPELIVLVYKNRFHAALPIRDSAMKTWKLAMSLDESVASESEFLEKYADVIITRLKEHVSSQNADVRETVFKAYDEIFQQKALVSSVTDRDSALQLLQLLAEGAMNEDGGKNAEFPRVAAINALASFIESTASTFKQDNDFQDQLTETLVPLNLELLCDISEDIVQSALKTVTAMVVGYGLGEKSREALYPLAGPVMMLAESEMEELKYPAIPVVTAMLSNVNEHIQRYPELVVHIVKGLQGPFGLWPADNDEEERRETASGVLHVLAETTPNFFTSPKLVEVLDDIVLLLAAGLLPEDNRETLIIQSNCLAFMLRLLSSEMFTSNRDKLSAQSRQLLKELTRMFLCLLTSDDECTFECGYEGPDDLEEEIDEDDEDSDLITFLFNEEDLEEKEVPSSQLYFTRTLALMSILHELVPCVMQDDEEAIEKVYSGIWKMIGVMFENAEDELKLSYRILVASILHHGFAVSQELLELTGAGHPAYQLWRIEYAFDGVDSQDLVQEKDLIADCSTTLKHKAHPELYNLALEEAGNVDEQTPLHRARKQTMIRVIATSRPETKTLADLVEDVAQLVEVPDNDAEFEQEDDDMYQWLQMLHDVHLSVFASFTDLQAVFKVIDHFFAHSEDSVADENLDHWLQDCGLISPEEQGAIEVQLGDEHLAEMCILEHVVGQEYFSRFHRKTELLENIVGILSEEESQSAEDFYVWLCKVFKQLVLAVPLEDIKKEWMESLLMTCGNKEFIEFAEGNAVIYLTAGLVEMLRLESVSEELEARVLQLMSDLVANEDMGPSKVLLEKLMQQLATVQFAKNGESPVVLPKPTPPGEHVNETFANDQ